MEFQLLASREDPSRALLLVPTLDESSLEGVEYQVFRDQGIMSVYLYDEGYGDGADSASGYRLRVPINSDTAPIVNQLSELVVLNPTSDSYRELPPAEQEQLQQETDWLPAPEPNNQ